MTEKLESLLNWAKANGTFIDERVSFEFSSSNGVHAIINKSIDEASASKELIKVPKSILITYELAQSVFGSQLNLKLVKNPNSLTQLLVANLKFNKTSPLELYPKFQPYIDYLPLSFSNVPYYWNSNEKKTLLQTQAGRSIKSNLKTYIEEWYTLVSQIEKDTSSTLSKDLKFYQDYTSGMINDDDLYELLNAEIKSWTSFQAYLWSSCCFFSRAFPYALISSSGKDINQAFLLPIVDLLNHENGKSVKWSYEPDTETVVFESLQKGLTKGTELFNNYGDKTNTELLLNYGFVLDKNEFENVSLPLKVENGKGVVEKCTKLGFKLPPFDEASGSVLFTLTRSDKELSEGLIAFFAMLHQLSSERGQYTLRMKLEGLQSLKGVLDQQVDLIKKSNNYDGIKNIRDHVVQQVKIYKRNQQSIYQNAIEQISRLEKALLKQYKPLSFKTVMKTDTKFANSLILSMGITSYDDMVAKKHDNTVLSLWFMRVFNRDFIEPKTKDWNNLYPDFIFHTFKDIKSKIEITREDVMENKDLYNTLFPSLSTKIPEVYNLGEWNMRNFITAGTVIDRLVYQRKASNEIYILDKHLMK